MKKVFLIGWKDVILIFRDKSALLLMLAAPFALTVGLGFVTGRFAGAGNAGLSPIPVVLVNQDGGQLGNAVVDLFQSNDLSTLIAPSVASDPSVARQQVDQDTAAAAITIPAGFTDSIIPAAGATPAGDIVQVALYANPTRPTGVGVVKAILDQFMSEVEVGRAGGMVAVMQLVDRGLIRAEDAPRMGAQIGARLASEPTSSGAITLKSVAGREAVQFDPLAYMAPGMALMFLMFTVSNGGRTLLAERAQGTLPRLLVSPTSTAQVLGGKIFGIYLTGVAQMLILIQASELLFGLSWGDSSGVLVLVLAAVAGAVGWGMLITALAKTDGQVSTIGTALMLTFGILGGTFVSLDMMPAWLRLVSRITPNAWGLEGFTTLALGGRLADVLQPAGALLAMGVILFGVALLLFRRRDLAQR